MTRPHMVRADSIDLQDPDQPSAQDHTKTNGANGTNGATNVGSHQAETLREVAQETAEEKLRSPRVSWTNGDNVGDLQQYAEDLTAGVTDSLNAQQNGYGGKKMQQQDALAVAQNGGMQDDSDLEVDGDDGMDDDMTGGISSSPSIEDEDIDFEFVYALHTFVATVEGQANATKGDTMVLLDDSNSYWWLVRVVKDSSIGYLPAEHIETPTERLARLNKHRNIDLSATMLGDQAEKTKPGFKSAIRRRKKTVTFAAPTYVDYSDIDYSTDEEDPEEMFAQQQLAAQQAREQQTSAASQQGAEEEIDDESAKVEPLKPRSKELKVAESAKDDDEDKRTSEDTLDGKADGVSRSRNGTVRNTDSFFKDDTVETKKITLTPNLLRDDNTPRASTDSKELRQRPSLDKVEKELMSDKAKDDKKKKDKKDKDKKPSVIRNFFSRKDKKKQGADEDDESFGKRSMDIVPEPQSRENLNEDVDADSSPEKGGLQRNPSKLQKQQPRTEPSPTRKGSIGAASQKTSTMELASYLSETRNDVSNVPPASMRVVDDKEDAPEDGKTESTRTGGDGQADKPATTSNADQSQKPTSSDVNVQEEVSTAKDPAARLQQEKQRREQQQRQEQEQQKARPTLLPGAYPDSYQSTGTAQQQQQQPRQQQPSKERLSESPVQVSPITPTNPPALVVDTSSQEDNSNSPSPELLEADEAGVNTKETMAPSSNSTTSSAGPQWDDNKLRAFFNSSSDIRDMLVVVYDKTDVAPAGPDHPVAGPLFREQNAKLAEITTQLDNMLGDWLARKQRLRGTL